MTAEPHVAVAAYLEARGQLRAGWSDSLRATPLTRGVSGETVLVECGETRLVAKRALARIKVGSTHRSDRTAKWNRLLQLESAEDTTFAGPWPPG